MSIIDFSEDLSNAEPPPPLPVGQYRAEIISAQEKVSQNSGNTYANIVFRVPASEYSADYAGDPDGVVLPYNRLLLEDNQTARWRLRKFLEAVGARLGRRLDLNDLVGLNGLVEIRHTVYEGENRAEIARVVAV